MSESKFAVEEVELIGGTLCAEDDSGLKENSLLSMKTAGIQGHREDKPKTRN